MKVHNVEQRSEAWYALRSGMPTASEFKSLITSTGKPSKSITPYAYRLAGEVLAGPSVGSWGGNNDMERGRTLEEDAAAWYSFVNDVDVEDIGFITDDNERMGCSPDKLVASDGLLEIKCLNTEKHVAVIVEHETTGKVPAAYIQQVHGQMLISERDWCDLVFHHHQLGGYVIRIHKDEEMETAILNGIDELIKTRDRALDILRRV